MGMESYQQGLAGEDIARQYLVQQGYEIIERNFSSSQGEIDLIAKDKEALVFIEVKNYSYRSLGTAVGAVGSTKKKSIVHAAESYLYKNDISDTYCRFDVIAIYRKFNGQRKIEHYKDAFSVN
ncbi:YraN family protein [Candidatus Margulisiibacteriota bacterium]